MTIVERPIPTAPGPFLDAVVALEASIQRAAYYYDIDAWDAAAFLLDLPEKERLSVVATTTSGRPVAFIVASRRPDGTAHIHRLAVDERQRRASIATSLLIGVVQRAGSAVSIVCDERNVVAAQLYRALGFVDRGRTDGGKALLVHPGLPPVHIRYVYNAGNAVSGHEAHVPRLIEALRRGGRSDAVAYGDPAGIPSFTLSPSWFMALLRSIRAARADGVDVFFVRIHWPLAALLAIAGRLLGWRTVLWSSGGPGVSRRTRSPGDVATELAHRLTLRYLVDMVATGPRILLDEYVERYGLRRDAMLLTANDIDVTAWRSLAESITSGSGRTSAAPEHDVLFIHTLDRLRGADRLPALRDEIRRDVPEAGILVVGDGPLRRDLETQPGLELIGRLPNSELPPIIARSRCIVVPSRQEGFPRVLLEGMALGVPVVAFDVGGCADILSDLAGHLLVPSGDVRSMAGKVTRILDGDGPSSDRLIGRALEFDTAIVAQRLSIALSMLVRVGPAAAARASRAQWAAVYRRG